MGFLDLLIQRRHSTPVPTTPTPFDDLANDIFMLETQGHLVADADTFSPMHGGNWNYLEDADASDLQSTYTNQSAQRSYSFSTPTSVFASTVASIHKTRRRDSMISAVSSGRSPSLITDSLEASPRPRRKSQSAQPLPRLMTDPSSILVEYYFKEVAGLFSCYDSHLNPFRSTVSRLWNTSSSVYYVVQSMAAACLADAFPQWTVVGTQMRSKAAASVEAEVNCSKVDTGSLLALVMLGLTASWHNANDLGRNEFNRARNIIGAMLDGKDLEPVENNERNLQFFREAMIYWEMLLSYVIDDTWGGPPEEPKPLSNTEASDLTEPSFPHPWTGVAREAQAIVFEVGRLIRLERHRIRNCTFTSSVDIDNARKALKTAEQLANRLQKLTLPAEDVIVSPADDQTPVKHFLAIAEAYRLTGLLQLYRVFPDLLGVQVSDQAQASSGLSESTISMHRTRLALDILDLLRAIPIESRTRCVQPFLLVAVTSELSITDPQETSSSSNIENIDDAATLTPTPIEVLQARKFVIGRLSTFEHVLPAKPIRQMVDIVTETWHRLDLGLPNVYWMDVMIEKGWETMMG
jgi:hypothetical protein